MIVEIRTVHLIKLDAIMREKKMSNQTLAELTGISRVHISRLRNQRSKATIPTAKKLLNALGVSDAVIDEVEEMPIFEGTWEALAKIKIKP